MTNSNVWQPYAFLQETYDKKFAVVKLNTPFQCQKSAALFQSLWEKAAVRACTDGAANILFDCITAAKVKSLPDFISGDFDSARPDVLKYFRSKGVPVIDTPDQNFTDFTKCLDLLVNKIKKDNLQISEIVAHVSNDDRLDHTMANINTLYHGHDMQCVPVYLILQYAVSFLLPKGKHTIDVSSSVRGQWCSLIPIGEPCHHVTTTGLKYNLNDQPMQFGKLISTSNSFDERTSVVTVDTDGPLLWTSDIQL